MQNNRTSGSAHNQLALVSVAHLVTDLIENQILKSIFWVHHCYGPFMLTTPNLQFKFLGRLQLKCLKGLKEFIRLFGD